MHYIDEILADDVEEDGEIHSEAEEDNDTRNKETEGGEDDKKEVKTPKKRKSRSTRPKLDLERLKGPRGLPYMEQEFSKFKFKGRGHEEEDLENFMLKLCLWCHRLYPRYTFDDTLRALETLGSKKPVLALKRKICMGEYEELPTIVDNEEATEPREQMDDFDLLLPTPSAAPEVEELTEEQKKMIELNRQLAAERRRARLEARREESQTEVIELSQESRCKDSEVFDRLKDEEQSEEQVLADMETVRSTMDAGLSVDEALEQVDACD